jgi:phospholipid-binding lipoprotein MlaA
MGITKLKDFKRRYLIVILFYIFTIHPVYSQTKYQIEESVTEYSQYDIDIETDLYDDYDENIEVFYDPFEKWNRRVFNFNLGFNKVIIEPIGKGYRAVTTKGMRRGVDNAVKNLRSPIILINSILQLDGENVARTISSFAINSTIGVLGFFNPAKKLDIYNEDKDFGQTLGKWKVGAGPYIVVPFLGPSTLRDGTGLIVDKAVDPLDYNMLEFGGKKPLMGWEFRWTRRILYGLTISNFVVETYAPMVESSFDPYVMTRNAYLQNRKFKINK